MCPSITHVPPQSGPPQQSLGGSFPPLSLDTADPVMTRAGAAAGDIAAASNGHTTDTTVRKPGADANGQAAAVANGSGHALEAAANGHANGHANGLANGHATAAANGGETGRVSRSKAARAAPPAELVAGKEVVGRSLEVYWPRPNEFVKGRIKEFDAATGRHRVQYDAKEHEDAWFALGATRFTWLDDARPHQAPNPTHGALPEKNDLVGAKIRVYWPYMGRWYLGTVRSYDKRTRKHEVAYKDGDHQLLRLRHEAVAVVELPPGAASPAAAAAKSPATPRGAAAASGSKSTPRSGRSAVSTTPGSDPGSRRSAAAAAVSDAGGTPTGAAANSSAPEQRQRKPDPRRRRRPEARSRGGRQRPTREQLDARRSSSPPGVHHSDSKVRGSHRDSSGLRRDRRRGAAPQQDGRGESAAARLPEGSAAPSGGKRARGGDPASQALGSPPKVARLGEQQPAATPAAAGRPRSGPKRGGSGGGRRCESSPPMRKQLPPIVTHRPPPANGHRMASISPRAAALPQPDGSGGLSPATAEGFAPPQGQRSGSTPTQPRMRSVSSIPPMAGQLGLNPNSLNPNGLAGLNGGGLLPAAASHAPTAKAAGIAAGANGSLQGLSMPMSAGMALSAPFSTSAPYEPHSLDGLGFDAYKACGPDDDPLHMAASLLRGDQKPSEGKWQPPAPLALPAAAAAQQPQLQQQAPAPIRVRLPVRLTSGGEPTGTSPVLPPPDLHQTDASPMLLPPPGFQQAGERRSRQSGSGGGARPLRAARLAAAASGGPARGDSALTGARIAVYWREDASYYKGTLAALDGYHKRAKVQYDDGEEEWLALPQHAFRWLAPRGRSAGCTEPFKRALTALDAQGITDEQLDPPPPAVAVVPLAAAAPIASPAAVDSAAAAAAAGPGALSLEPPVGQAGVGHRVSIWCPGDGNFHRGEVLAYDRHRGQHHVLYEDGEDESMRLTQETVRWHGPALPGPCASGLAAGKPVPRGQQAVGWRIGVYWREDRAFYVGDVESFDAASGRHSVAYDDGEEEEVQLGLEKVKWLLPPNVGPSERARRARRARRGSGGSRRRPTAASSSEEEEEEDDDSDLFEQSSDEEEPEDSSDPDEDFDSESEPERRRRQRPRARPTSRAAPRTLALSDGGRTPTGAVITRLPPASLELLRPPPPPGEPIAIRALPSFGALGSAPQRPGSWSQGLGSGSLGAGSAGSLFSRLSQSSDRGGGGSLGSNIRIAIYAPRQPQIPDVAATSAADELQAADAAAVPPPVAWPQEAAAAAAAAAMQPAATDQAAANRAAAAPADAAPVAASQVVAAGGATSAAATSAPAAEPPGRPDPAAPQEAAEQPQPLVQQPQQQAPMLQQVAPAVHTPSAAASDAAPPPPPPPSPAAVAAAAPNPAAARLAVLDAALGRLQDGERRLALRSRFLAITRPLRGGKVPVPEALASSTPLSSDRTGGGGDRAFPFGGFCAPGGAAAGFTGDKAVGFADDTAGLLTPLPTGPQQLGVLAASAPPRLGLSAMQPPTLPQPAACALDPGRDAAHHAAAQHAQPAAAAPDAAVDAEAAPAPQQGLPARGAATGRSVPDITALPAHSGGGSDGSGSNLAPPKLDEVSAARPPPDGADDGAAAAADPQTPATAAKQQPENARSPQNGRSPGAAGSGGSGKSPTTDCRTAAADARGGRDDAVPQQVAH